MTVHPGTLPAGSSDVELTFRVPNERDNATTVGLQVFFPTDLPLLTIDVLPVTGWTAKVTSRTLATPVTTDDGTVSQVVSAITWAAKARGIAPGQYEDVVVGGRAGAWPAQPGPGSHHHLGVLIRGRDNPVHRHSTTAETLGIAAPAVSLAALGGIAVRIVRKSEPFGSATSTRLDDRSQSGV